jgi:transposase
MIGRTGKRASLDIEKRVVAFYKKGLSTHEIAKTGIVSKTTVERILKRHEVKTRTRSESMALHHKRRKSNGNAKRV